MEGRNFSPSTLSDCYQGIECYDSSQHSYQAGQVWRETRSSGLNMRDDPELGLGAGQGGFSSAACKGKLKPMSRRRGKEKKNEEDKVFCHNICVSPPENFISAARISSIRAPRGSAVIPAMVQNSLAGKYWPAAPLSILGTFGILLENLKPGRITGSRQDVGLKHRLLGKISFIILLLLVD